MYNAAERVISTMVRPRERGRQGLYIFNFIHHFW